jgi:hypothetical protein
MLFCKPFYYRFVLALQKLILDYLILNLVVILFKPPK